jgi:hypothetical protein
MILHSQVYYNLNFDILSFDILSFDIMDFNISDFDISDIDISDFEISDFDISDFDKNGRTENETPRYCDVLCSCVVKLFGVTSDRLQTFRRPTSFT